MQPGTNDLVYGFHVLRDEIADGVDGQGVPGKKKRR
jgi:hypothetical protein